MGMITTRSANVADPVTVEAAAREMTPYLSVAKILEWAEMGLLTTCIQNGRRCVSQSQFNKFLDGAKVKFAKRLGDKPPEPKPEPQPEPEPVDPLTAAGERAREVAEFSEKIRLRLETAIKEERERQEWTRRTHQQQQQANAPSGNPMQVMVSDVLPPTDSEKQAFPLLATRDNARAIELLVAEVLQHRETVANLLERVEALEAASSEQTIS